MDADSLGKTAVALPSERPSGLSDPCLVVIAGPNMGKTYDLGDEAIQIGRQEECTIAVPSTKVSRQHAAVQRVLGQYVVCDLGSTNGTFVNGERIQDAHRLIDGDQIKIGELVLKYIQSKLELQYHQQIHELVARDPLTGAENKRSFDDALLAASKDRGGSLIVYDIDHFKAINDEHGHPAGDHVLKDLTARVATQVGDRRLFRIGGEEFAILCCEGLNESRPLGEALRQSVAERAFVFEGTPIAVTLSLGVTAFAAGSNPKETFRRADGLMYQSKREGRNRVSSG